MSDWGRIQAMLDAGAAEGAAPHLAFLAWRSGAPAARLAAGRAKPETVFDLASLTKPLATALIALALDLDGRLPWSASLGEIMGSPPVPADKAGITIAQLLSHAAGYPAYQPYHQALERQPRPGRAGLLMAMLMNEPLAHAPGSQALYSDLGYLLLGLVLVRAADLDLPRLLARTYASLGVADGPGFRPLGQDAPDLADIAPCGALPGRPAIHGQVEDENAFALGGAAGHAGLFGNVDQVAAVMDALCRSLAGRGPWPADAVARLFALDAATPGSPRTPGFDTPSGPESAAGPNPPPGVVGHLGFTGVSLWWRPQDNSGLALLTNRVALGRDNDKIKALRRQIHAAAWPLLGY
ncbi:MAG: serine hydrolase domain-containing protein [Thermodesulfobacteriota bacterium]